MLPLPRQRGRPFYIPSHSSPDGITVLIRRPDGSNIPGTAITTTTTDEVVCQTALGRVVANRRDLYIDMKTKENN